MLGTVGVVDRRLRVGIVVCREEGRRIIWSGEFIRSWWIGGVGRVRCKQKGRGRIVSKSWSVDRKANKELTTAVGLPSFRTILFKPGLKESSVLIASVEITHLPDREARGLASQLWRCSWRGCTFGGGRLLPQMVWRHEKKTRSAIQIDSYCSTLKNGLDEPYAVPFELSSQPPTSGISSCSRPTPTPGKTTSPKWTLSRIVSPFTPGLDPPKISQNTPALPSPPTNRSSWCCTPPFARISSQLGIRHESTSDWPGAVGWLIEPAGAFATLVARGRWAKQIRIVFG
jgi:hypothetical protein